MAGLSEHSIIIIGYREIYGKSGLSYDEIRQALSEYELDAVLQSIAKLSMKLYGEGPYNKALQALFAANFLKKEDHQKLIDALARHAQASGGSADDPWVIIGEQSLQILCKLAVESCRRDGEGKLITDQAVVDDLMVWLLSVCDLAYNPTGSNILKPASVTIEKIAAHAFRQHFLWGLNDQGDQRTVRYYTFFEVMQKRGNLDVDQLFKDATGVDLFDYLAVGLGVSANWMKATAGKADIEKEWLICRDTYLKNTSIKDADVDAILKLFAVDVDGFDAEYKEIVDQLLGGNDLYEYNSLVFKIHPLLKLHARDCYICISPNFLLSRATEGVYWIVEKDLLDKGDKQNRSLFAAEWGKAFEQYINERLQSTFDGSYYPNPEDAKNIERGDGILSGKKYIFIVEAKSAHWTYKGQLTAKTSDNQGALDRLLSEKEGLGQIKRNVKDLDNGLWSLPFDRGGRKIVPVLILSEPMPVDGYSRYVYEKYADDHNARINNSEVLPFIVLDAEEVELLESIAEALGSEVADSLLSDYVETHLNKGRYGIKTEADSFKNFLVSRGVKTKKSQFIRDGFKQYSEEIRRRLFPKGK